MRLAVMSRVVYDSCDSLGLELCCSPDIQLLLRLWSAAALVGVQTGALTTQAVVARALPVLFDGVLVEHQM